MICAGSEIHIDERPRTTMIVACFEVLVQCKRFLNCKNIDNLYMELYHHFNLYPTVLTDQLFEDECICAQTYTHGEMKVIDLFPTSC